MATENNLANHMRVHMGEKTLIAKNVFFPVLPQLIKKTPEKHN